MIRWFLMFAVACCLSVSSAGTASADPQGRIYNTTHKSVIIYRDDHIDGVSDPIYKILGPNCASPPGEDWDFVADPSLTIWVWRKAGYTTGWEITYSFSDYLQDYEWVSYFGLSVQVWIDWCPPTPPAYVYPIQNPVTIDPLQELPLSPFIGVQMPGTDPMTGATINFVEPTPSWPTIPPII